MLIEILSYETDEGDSFNFKRHVSFYIAKMANIYYFFSLLFP